MHQLDDWIQRISEGKIDAALQNEIADKILKLLEQKKTSLGTREKILFAEAITALSININSIYPSNEAGLRRCLIAVHKLLIPEDLLNESYTEREDEGNRISYTMLIATVQLLKRQIV